MDDMLFTFPVSVSSNRRFLVDAQDRPFLVHGDTAWSLISALERAEVEQYLADRAEKGVNAIIVNLVEHKFNGPLNRSGDHPFLDPGDVSTPNQRYFDHADWVIRRAADYGILVFLAPLYLGYKHARNDEGWFQESQQSGANKCYRYGRFLGERYTSFHNIIWMMGGDRNPDGVMDEVNALMVGIKESDHHSLFTAHAAPEYSTPEQYGLGGWLDLSGTYTYQIVHRKLLADYNHKPVLPFVLMETTYEGEHNASEVQVRRQAYWALLCGACGQFFGNRPVWGFFPGWQAALDSPGARSMAYLKRLFTSRAWYDLIPDQKHEVVIGGLGEFNGLDTLAAARTADGSTVIAYLPSARPVKVDLEKINGNSACAWWFDPCTGQSQPAGEYPAMGTQTFSPPGPGDWALVIDDPAKGRSAPGD